MKKTVVFLLIGLLMVGVNVFAAGDLIVNGKIGIGTTETPSSKLDIVTDNTNGVNVNITQTTDMIASGGEFNIVVDGSTNLTNSTALSADVRHVGTSDLPTAVRGGQFMYMFRSTSPGDSAFTAIYGVDSIVRDHYTNARNYTGDLIAGFRLQHIYDGIGQINVTDLVGALLKNPAVIGTNALNATNLYGMHIEKQTAGTNNYGIVLDGDGNGADISFGYYTDGGAYSGRPSIYSSNGQLYANDYLGNQTLNSPHDPVTGEWIFYSKNVKTGKVVKVNMEKLVKAVEKITGETFMIETIEEIE